MGGLSRLYPQEFLFLNGQARLSPSQRMTADGTCQQAEIVSTMKERNYTYVR